MHLYHIFVNMPDLFDKDKDCNIYLKKHNQNIPDFVHSLWNIYLFEKSAVVMVWKRPSIRIQFQKSMAPSTNRFQHHFKLRSIYKHPCVFSRSWHSLKWMFITIRKMFLQNCVRFPQTLKQNSKFQDGVLLSM